MDTIKSSRDVETVFRCGRRAAHPVLIALVNPTSEGRGLNGRVAFIAGKRLGNAVRRNRAKRVLRGAVARAGGPWRGFDVALIARESTADVPAVKLDEALKDVLARSGVA